MPGCCPNWPRLARARLRADGVPAGELTLTGGALDGIERLLGAHLRPGDAVAVEDPGWANLLDLVAALGLRPIGVPVDDEGPLVAGVAAALAAGARALIVTSRAQNPTGAAVSAARAEALRTLLAGRRDAAADRGRPRGRTGPRTPAPARRRDGELGLRPLGEQALRPGPADGGAGRRRDHGGPGERPYRGSAPAGSPRCCNAWSLALWRDPAVTELVRRAAQSYEQRREGLLAALAEHGLTAHGRSGINVWLPVADETSTVTALRDAGWAVAPGALYRIAAPPALRITVSSLDAADLAPLAAALAQAENPPPGQGFPT